MMTRVPRGSRSPFEPQRYRAVIDKLDVHHGAKLAALDFKSSLAKRGQESLVQGDRLFGTRRVDEARSLSLLGVAVKRELRDDEYLSADLRETKIHLSVGIAE